MARDSERDALILSLRVEGATLAEIGEAVGLTRERVRQIVAAADSTVSTADLRRRRQELVAKEAEARSVTIADDLTTNPGSTYAEVSRRTGIPERQVRQLIPGRLRKLIVELHARDLETWEDLAIQSALQRAQTFDFPLRTTTYSMLVERGEVDGPSVARLYQRYGSWRRACDLAGVEAAPPIRSNYESRWTDEDILRFVCDYLSEDDCTGTFADYEAWARSVPEAPSGGTIRNRLGGWAFVKLLVFEGIWRERQGLPPQGTFEGA